MVEISDGDYKAYITNDNILIQHLQYNKVLNIDKNTRQITESNPEILRKITTQNIYKPHAILGIITIENYNFIIFVKTAYFVGKIEEAEIFRVKDTEIIPIVSESIIDIISNDIKSLTVGIKNLLTLGFFYSFNYDLTNSRQRQSKLKNFDILKSANKKFFWNYNLYKKFFLENNKSQNNSKNNSPGKDNNYINKNITYDVNLNINYENIKKNANNNLNNIPQENFSSPILNKIWMVVCIYGYVGIAYNNIDMAKIGLYLISRRSIHHAGTRYLTRGIDDDGHVANFVETEQIIKIDNNLYSFMQFRGSVPVFFQQTGITAQTEITRIPKMAAPAFKKHIEEMKIDYNLIYLINLMNVNKPNEHIITQSYEEQIKINELKNCKYLFWDFQNQCKYDNYENLDLFVKNLESVFKIFKYYHENTYNGDVLKEQNGIIRTNCLDCLDRTNVVQGRIAWKVLEIHLRSLNINCGEIFDSSFISAKNTKTHPIMESFKDIWGENGDSISFQYAGTASCITSVTKNGKHGFLGLFQHGLVSITRFYQGNFEDGFKQKCIDSLLQFTEEKSKKIFFIYLATTNSQIQPKFSPVEKKISELTVFVGSWNVAGRQFPSNTSLINWFYPQIKDMETPDIYIIGLQEIVDLNAKNIIVFTSNSTRVESWNNLITKNLKELGNFVMVKTVDLVGLFLVIFIKENLCGSLRNIESTIIRTGLMGTMGNKGSCMIRFNFNETSFIVSCCHLKAGAKNVDSRLTEISDILNKNIHIKNSKEIKFKDHDVQFIFGDLNFRVEMEYNNCLEFIKTGYIETLILYDQLMIKKSSNHDLFGLEELPIKFPPTYKFQLGTNEYCLKDKRTPSWCDRILFNRSENVKGLFYNHVECTDSDHKPIYGIYKINLDKSKKINFSENYGKNFIDDKKNTNQNFDGKFLNNFVYLGLNKDFVNNKSNTNTLPLYNNSNGSDLYNNVNNNYLKNENFGNLYQPQGVLYDNYPRGNQNLINLNGVRNEDNNMGISKINNNNCYFNYNENNLQNKNNFQNGNNFGNQNNNFSNQNFIVNSRGYNYPVLDNHFNFNQTNFQNVDGLRNLGLNNK